MLCEIENKGTKSIITSWPCTRMRFCWSHRDESNKCQIHIKSQIVPSHVLLNRIHGSLLSVWYSSSNYFLRRPSTSNGPHSTLKLAKGKMNINT
jgi:hypothetical protein